jgi:hypothetical protein
MQLYSITEQDFERWIESGPSEDELREAYFVLEAKRSALWSPNTDDSYFRDRFDRDTRYVKRLVRIKQALADTWISTGQIAAPIA